MKDISTTAIHGGEAEPRIEGSVTMPVFQSATYEFRGGAANDSEANYIDIKYSRLNNTPNHLVLNKKLALLEQGEAGLVLGSGMAAVSTTALALLSNGDHVVAQKTLYGATMSFFKKDLARFGISCDFADEGDLEKHIGNNTKMIYAESISNPLMEVPDFGAVTALAKKHGLISVIDNTFATPVNFRPLSVGFDLTLHSATKYLNGHSDVIAGCVVGSKKLIDKINNMAVHLGGTLDPHACSLLHRGLKTLSVRVERQNQSAIKIAEHLSRHAKIKAVKYPGLESHASFKNAKKYFYGFGGMMSFDLKNPGAVGKFISTLKLPIHAPSLGGVESLVIQPARSSHASLTPGERQKSGIGDGLIRLSIGLEHTDDLIQDLDQALAQI